MSEYAPDHDALDEVARREQAATFKRKAAWEDFGSMHFTRFAARRARKRWMQSGRGRDAYVNRLGRFHWEVRRIDYHPPSRAR